MTSVEPNFVSYALLAHTGLHIPLASQEDFKERQKKKTHPKTSLSSDYKQQFWISNFTESSLPSKNEILVAW